MAEEILDGYFSVFNNHINDADRRARAAMRQLCPAFLEQVEAIEKEGNGIMAIFQQSPTPATSYYAALVQYFVNEGKLEMPSSVISVEVPQYEHDCESCVFLGNYENENGRYDLYYHGGDHKTVIGRYGNDGGDYSSGMVFGRDGLVPELAEAYNRAKEQGLDVD